MIYSFLRIQDMKYQRTEFEEVFADVAFESDKDNSRLEVPISRKTPYIFLTFIFLLFSFFWVRTLWLAIFEGEQWSLIAARNTERVFPILAPRGIIYDYSGEALVENVPIFRIVVDLTRMPQDKNILASQLGYIAKSLEIPQSELEDRLAKSESSTNLVLIREVKQENAVELSLIQAQNDIFWMSIESVPERVYRDSTAFAHVLGYTSEVTKEDIGSQANYLPTEEIGKTGIEASFDGILRGITGKNIFVVDAKGKTDKTFIEQEAKSGKNIRLTIDSKLQKALFKSLAQETKKAGARSAAAVALDPRDGSVRALVSFPSYDNNAFAQGISSEDYSKLISDNAKPLLNRVVSGLYPSGSVIKPVVGLAALTEKVITPQKRISDPGFITVSNIYDPSIIYTYRDWKAHGSTNFVEAIAESCDVYFYTVGGGYGDIIGLGIDRLAGWLRQFNLDKETGIDLPSEVNGLIPTPEWKEKEKGEPWVLGNTYHLSIGQGDLLVTPIGLATAISSIVNGGTVYKPKLIESIFEKKDFENKTEGQVINKISASEENFNWVKRGMRAAVNSSEGTAKLLNQVKVSVAAKTGTAQVGSKRTHAWIAAYAPYDDPELVVVVLIENGGEGSIAAAPVAKAALDAYFEDKDQ